MFLIVSYLAAIVLANLITAQFGPSASIFNAFFLIGLDLTTRDSLHEKWQGDWRKLSALIASGSILSAILNINAAPIAVASFAAFAAAGVVDTLVYKLLGDKSKLVKVNGSNLVSAAVDSLVFPALAFGFPLLWGIVIGQFAAKVVGGFIWSLVINREIAMELKATP